MEYQNIANILDTTSDSAPKFNTKNGLKFMIGLVMQKTDTNQVANKI